MKHPVPQFAEESTEEVLLHPGQFRCIVARLQHQTVRSQTVWWCAPIATTAAVFCGTYWGKGWNLYCILRPAETALLFGTLRMCVWRGNSNKAVRETARLLRFMETTEDVHTLGELLTLAGSSASFGSEYQPACIAARPTVLRLLPQVQVSDPVALSESQRGFLHDYLLSGPERSLPALHALEQIGNKADLIPVQRLLKANYPTDEVRAAAHRCAQTIAERVAQEADANILLRASREPRTGAILLRPASEHAEPPPQHLLRAASSEVPGPPL